MPEPIRTPEEQLAWEAERRPRAIVAAVAAAALVLGGSIYASVAASRDFPQVGLTEAITPALQGRPSAAIDPHVAAARFFDDNAAQLTAGAAISALGTLAMAYALLYLAEAIRARRPEFQGALRWLPLIGAVLAAAASIGRPVAFAANARDYLHGPRIANALDQISNHGATPLLNALGIAGQFAIAFAFVLIGLNAMRVGLLTRFMGVLAIIVGVLFVIPLGPLPIVQAFWLGALAPLFAMRWPAGQPPAWVTGRAEPWPSADEVRRRREASHAHAEARAIKASPAASEAAEPVRPAHPSSKKRRKKRR